MHSCASACSTRRAFTLIELLVVVAIISLLLSILLPSLTCARDQAKSAKCGVTLRSFGVGMTSYATEHGDYIPGINTTGVALESYRLQQGNGAWRDASMPVQNFDWMTPLLRYDSSDIGVNRAERFTTALTDYRCPSMGEFAGVYRLTQLPDRQDFQNVQRPRYGVSYLMPAHFQYWGQNDRNVSLGRYAGLPNAIIRPKVANPQWEVVVDSFRSRLDKLGLAARKIAIADGTRYLDLDDPAFPEFNGLDFDASPWAALFGSFTSTGAWWSGSTAYGVNRPSANWDGQALAGSGPPGNGQNLWYSYRHGCNRSPQADTAQSNRGRMNALHFDGHVENLDDRQSREIHLWYPKGARVRQPGEGMTSVPNNFVIP